MVPSARGLLYMILVPIGGPNKEVDKVCVNEYDLDDFYKKTATYKHKPEALINISGPQKVT